ncbi:MAG: winged helix-turn-helix transcriptional regulator [Vulcanisaeta sp.]|nr:winged helix-turn-helix transcriptional regulator [Vulcanisaeta sp.]
MLPIIMISIIIYLMGNGSLVSINVTTTQSVALLNITLPVEPIAPTLTVQSANGSSIPAMLMGNNLIIPVFGNGTFMVKYVPSITQSPSGYLLMNISSPYIVSIFVSNDVLITHLPINLIINFTKVNNGIVLQLAPGNYSIGFIPETPTTHITTQPTTSTTTNTTVGIGQTTPQTVKRAASSMPQYVYYVIPIVIAAAVALLIYAFVIRRRGPEVNPVIVEGLNPTDREVIKALIEMGGEAYQADLQRKLNIPKATLWRAIKRLEATGYVQVIKEGRVNKVRLIRKPSDKK